MKKNKQIIKLFFVLLFSTAFIFSSAHFGVLAFGNIKNNVNKNTLTTSKSSNPEKTHNETSDNENLKSETPKKEIILTQSIIKLGDIPVDLQTFLEQGSKIEIPEKSTFSMLEFVQEQKLDKLDSETLSLITSGIYHTILTTNFLIMERNIGNSLPNFVTPGFEAMLNFDQNVDFAFSNPNNSKYTIDLVIVDNSSLKVSLKGEKFPNNYKITKDIQNFKPRTIIQYSPLLASGKVKITSTGKEGNLVKVYRDVFKGDQLVKRELISSDYYPPIYRVEIHSLNNTSNNQSSLTSAQTITPPTENQTNTDITLNDNQNSNPSKTKGQAPNSDLGQTVDMPK